MKKIILLVFLITMLKSEKVLSSQDDEDNDFAGGVFPTTDSNSDTYNQALQFAQQNFANQCHLNDYQWDTLNDSKNQMVQGILYYYGYNWMVRQRLQIVRNCEKKLYNFMDQLFHDNGLQRKQIPIGQNSLFKAISDSLYFTTQYHQQISKQIVQYLEKQIASDLIPQSLQILKTNQTLMNDYCKQPSFHGFDLFNLQLTSMLFRVKINLYFVQDNKLMKRIFNDHYVKMIELSRDENNHYDSVWTKEYIQNVTYIQQILYQHINKIFDLQCDIPKIFKNIELDNWLNEQNFTENRNYKKNRSNSEDKNKQQDLLQQELENIKKTQYDEESTIIQINNLKRNPPGLDNNRVTQFVDTPNKKPQILDVPEIRETGKLKFFDESKSYGFIVLDSDKSDVFVHLDDLQKAGITKEDLRKLGSCFRSQTQVNHYGRGNEKPPQFSFQLMTYLGKYNKSRKAVDLKLIE